MTAFQFYLHVYTIRGRKRLNCRTGSKNGGFHKTRLTAMKMFFGEILKVSTWVVWCVFQHFSVIRRLIQFLKYPSFIAAQVP